ncbi:MAG: O-antigen ligase family protein [Verrucomicrobiales bacterium]
MLITFVLLGYLWLAVAGTGTKVVFQWPGLLLLGVGFAILPFARGGTRLISTSAFCHFTVAMLFAYMVARAWVSPVFYLARLDIILVLTLFGVYVAFTTSLSGSRFRLIFVFLILALGVVNTLVAVYQLKVDQSFNILPGYERQGAGGQLSMPGGLYNLHPHFAGFLEIAALLGIATGLFARGLGWLRGCAFAFAAVAVTGIALSQSRGALMALGAGGLVLSIMFIINLRILGRFYWSMRKLVLWILGITVSLAIVGAITFTSFSKRFDSVDHALLVSGRANFWAGAVDQWLEAPLFGTGARSFHYRYPAYRPPEAPFHQRDPEFAHNDYFQQAAEYGLIGALLILLIFCSHLINAVRGLRCYAISEDKSNPAASASLRFALLAGASAVIVAHAIHAFVDFHMRMVATAVPIVFCLAILANPGFEVNQRRRSAVGFGMRWVAAGCCIGLFVFAARFGMASWELEKGYLQIKGGNPDTAVAHLQKAIELDPVNADPLRSLALIRYYKKDADLPAFVKVQFQGRAREAYLKAIAIHPFDGFSHIGAGNCEMFLAWHGGAAEAGDYWKSAREHFEQAIVLAPTQYKPREAHALYRLNRAYYLGNTGDLEAAGNEARAALEEFEKVSGYFVHGAPRGHRANSGAKSARALLKLLEDKGAAATSRRL